MLQLMAVVVAVYFTVGVVIAIFAVKVPNILDTKHDDVDFSLFMIALGPLMLVYMVVGIAWLEVSYRMTALKCRSQVLICRMRFAAIDRRRKRVNRRLDYVNRYALRTLEIHARIEADSKRLREKYKNGR